MYKQFSRESILEVCPPDWDTKLVWSNIAIAFDLTTFKTLEKKDFDFRITHRFGNIATSESYRTLFGLDNSSDIRIGFEYGISDKFMLGVGRSKGASPFLEVWDGLLKYKIVNKDKYIITEETKKCIEEAESLKKQLNKFANDNWDVERLFVNKQRSQPC